MKNLRQVASFFNVYFASFVVCFLAPMGVNGFLIVTNIFDKVETLRFFAILYISYDTESIYDRYLQFDDTGQSYQDKENYKPTLKK